MNTLESVLKALKSFSSYRIYDTETVHLTIGTFLTIVIALIVVTYVLKLVHRLVTALPQQLCL